MRVRILPLPPEWPVMYFGQDTVTAIKLNQGYAGVFPQPCARSFEIVKSQIKTQAGTLFFTNYHDQLGDLIRTMSEENEIERLKNSIKKKRNSSIDKQAVILDEVHPCNFSKKIL